MKGKKQVNLKTWLIPKLRRLSYQWPPRSEAKRAARVARGLYKCALCQNVFKDKETQMDHTYPVVPLDGMDTQAGLEQILGKYVISLFVYEPGWQCLCKPCHDKKTESENKIRNSIKKLLTKR